MEPEEEVEEIRERIDGDHDSLEIFLEVDEDRSYPDEEKPFYGVRYTLVKVEDGEEATEEEWFGPYSVKEAWNRLERHREEIERSMPECASLHYPEEGDGVAGLGGGVPVRRIPEKVKERIYGDE